MTSARTRSAVRLLLVAASLLFASGSCQGPAGPQVEAPGPGCAQCPVCRTEGDLACVNVRIRPDTPTACHCGCTYYFCSAQCKQDFEREPGKYLGH